MENDIEFILQRVKTLAKKKMEERHQREEGK